MLEPTTIARKTQQKRSAGLQTGCHAGLRPRIPAGGVDAANTAGLESGATIAHHDLFTAGALGFLVLLGGCRVGPPYHAPAPPAVTAPNYKESTVNFHDTEGWKVASPQDAMIRGNWWEVFNEPELNALEEQLNINNQNLKEYFQNYMAARAEIAEARSQYWPTITANSVLEPFAEHRPTSVSLQQPRREPPPACGICRSMFRGRRISGAKFATRCTQRNMQRR